MRKLGLRACGLEADIPRSMAVKNRYLAELSLLRLCIENSSSMFIIMQITCFWKVFAAYAMMMPWHPVYPVEFLHLAHVELSARR